MPIHHQEKKIVWAFGAILALLATTSALAVFLTSWLASQADLIYIHPFTVSVAIRRIEADTVRMRLAMKEMTRADTSQEVEEILSRVNSLDESVRGNMEVLESRYLGPDQDIEDLKAALEKWRPVRAAIAELVRQGRQEQAEELTRPGGEGWKHWAAVDRAVETIAAYAQGKANYFLGRSRDLTSRTISVYIVSAVVFTLAGCVIALLVLRSLKRGRETFQATFEQAAVGMAHACLKGRWLLVNNKLCSMLGYGREELLTLSSSEIIHPDDRLKGAQSQELLKAGDIPMYAMEKRFLRKDGGVLWTDVTVSMAKETGEAQHYFIYVVQDISERKRVEYELEKARSFIRNIINSMPSVVIGVDSGGRITHLNHKAAGQLSLAPAHVVGASLAEYFPEYSSEMDAIRRAIAERKPVLKEKMPQTVNGDIRYQDVLIYPLVANGVEGAVLRIDDVTERVRLTEMMVQTEKMMSVGGLAAGMAHEINNPLGAILQSAQVILMHLDPSHEPNKRAAAECGCDMQAIAAYMAKRNVPVFLEAVREAGARAARIVANMLEFSRRSESSKEPVPLREVLERTLELASSDYDLKKKYDFRHIEIAKDFTENLPPAYCSRTEIEQVALNILKNAAQAMAAGKYEDGGPRIELRTYTYENMVCFDIEDNGPGMEEEVRKRVFEPFFTTKQPGQGTGLGLSVSYFIVTSNHGGTINVDSAPGMGACFSVCLPRASAGEAGEG